MFVRLKDMIKQWKIRQELFDADFRTKLENITIGELVDEYDDAKAMAEENEENRATGN